MNFYNLSAQVMGVAAFILSAISFQAKSFKMINILKIVSQILFTLQYFMLGVFTAMFMNMFSLISIIIGIIRLDIPEIKKKFKKKV